MFDTDEILAMLQDGYTTDEIASKFTDSLNEAREIQEKQEKELKYQEFLDERDAQMEVVLTALYNYLEIYEPNGKELANSIKELLDGEGSIRAFCDEFAEIIEAGNALKKFVDEAPSSYDDILDTFLKDMNLR